MSTMELQIEQRLEKSTEGDSDEAASSLPMINTLDDDCLMKIFSYLPIEDHMRIERVCKRWQAVNLQSWNDVKSMKFSTFHFIVRDFQSHKLDMYERFIVKVLSRCGGFLKRLNCEPLDRFCDIDIIPIIVDHCRNLRWLTLHLKFHADKNMVLLVSSLHRLERLQLFDVSEEFIDENLKNISSDSLKELYLNSTRSETDCVCSFTCVTWTGAMNIQAIKNLWKLEFYGLSFTVHGLKAISLNKSITYLSFLNCRFKRCIDSIANFRGLKHLLIPYESRLNDDLLMALAANCEELEELNIEGCTAVTNTGVSSLIVLEKLTSLKIDRICEVGDCVLSLFMTLKVLHCEKCRLVGDNGIIQLIQNSPHLEEINLYATLVSSKTLDAAYDVAVTRANEIPLKVIVCCTLESEWDRPSDILPSALIIEGQQKEDDSFSDYFSDDNLYRPYFSDSSNDSW